MEQTELTIDNIYALLKRRKHWIIWPALVGLLIALVVALILPNIYKSEASILIENSQISEGLVASTVTTFADQRIEAIKQEIMSRSKILELVDKYDLYPEKREQISTNALVEKVQQSIIIEPVSAAIQRGTKTGYVTIAFIISFEGKHPAKLQQVVNELTSFFLQENLQARRESAKGTTEFLVKQVEKAQKQLEEQEHILAGFKEKHLEELPEFMQLNMQKIDKIDQKINNIDQQILALREQAISVKYKLGFMNPYSASGNRVLSEEEKLQELELRLTEFMSRYSPKHPKVLALEKEIDSLQRTVSRGPSLRQKRSRLEGLEQNLIQYLSKYSKEHPVVKRITAEIEQLKEEIEKVEAKNLDSGNTTEVNVRNVTNPAYINLQSELDRIELRTTTLEEQKNRLKQEEKEIYEKLRSMPNIEKEYQDLLLDRDQTKQHLANLQNKLQVAQVAEGMEEGQLAEKFSVTEPAYLPDEPFKPNRFMIILLGLVLGVGVSGLLAAFKEYSDDTVRLPEEVERLSNHRVLATIPHVVTPKEQKRKRIKFISIPVLTGSFIFAGIATFHYMVMDLYIFYDKLAELLSDRFFIFF